MSARPSVLISAALRVLSGGAGSAAMLRSARGLITGKALSMGLGFAFWLLAARLAPASEVGLAAGATAAAMLAVQVSLLGIDGAVIRRYPVFAGAPGAFLGTALGIVALASLGTAFVFLAISDQFFVELGEAARDARFAALFVMMAVLGTVGAMLDRISMARHEGSAVALRNAVNGIVTILPLIVVPFIDAEPTALSLFAFWIVGTGSAVLVGLGQLRGSMRLGSGVSLTQHARGLLGDGWRFYPLALSERMPALALPVIVTEVISPEANAHWYALWMMAWAAYVIPSAHSVALFAEGARSSENLVQSQRRSVQSALLLSAAAAVSMAILGWPVLSLLGPEYASEGIVPLLIMLLAVMPLSYTATYYGVCRGTNRLGEALVTSVVSGAAVLVLAIPSAAEGGLTGLALTWLVVGALTALWSLLRMRRILNETPSVLDAAAAELAAHRVGPPA